MTAIATTTRTNLCPHPACMERGRSRLRCNHRGPTIVRYEPDAGPDYRALAASVARSRVTGVRAELDDDWAPVDFDLAEDGTVIRWRTEYLRRCDRHLDIPVRTIVGLVVDLDADSPLRLRRRTGGDGADVWAACVCPDCGKRREYMTTHLRNGSMRCPCKHRAPSHESRRLHIGTRAQADVRPLFVDFRGRR